jgi:hypothetical protein
MDRIRTDEVYKYLTANGWLCICATEGGNRWRRQGEPAYRPEDEALAEQHAAMRLLRDHMAKEAARLQAENEALRSAAIEAESHRAQLFAKLRADFEELRSQVSPLLSIECELRAIDATAGVATFNVNIAEMRTTADMPLTREQVLALRGKLGEKLALMVTEVSNG